MTTVVYHKNRKPDGPLTVEERKALVSDWHRRYPEPIRLLVSKMPSLVRAAAAVGMDDDDINSCCFLGAANAARLYDPAFGAAFDSFAYLHMVGAMERAMGTQFTDHRHRGTSKLVSFNRLSGESREEWETVAARPEEPDEQGESVKAAVWRVVLSRVPDPTDRDVVAMRWGLCGHEPHTLDQIGDVLGVCKERVRQRETRAKRRCEKELMDLLSPGA